MTTTIAKKSNKATSAKAKASAKKAAPATLEATPKMTALEAAKAKKLPKTVLDNGLTYSLLTRVRNAFNKNLWAKMEKGFSKIDMVDGRGTEQSICNIYVEFALDLGGADYLKTVRTSHVRRALREKGIAVK